MRIAYLITDVHDMGGTANAVITQANALCTRNEVEVLSVYRSSSSHHFPVDPRVRVRDLVDLRDDHVRVAGLDETTAMALRGSDPLLLPTGVDPSLDALADVALEATLPTLDADVLITVTPALLAYSALAPARTAIVHQEHRSSSQRALSRDLFLDHARRADVVAMLTEPMAAWLLGELGPTAPEVVVVPNAVPPGFRPRSLLTEPVIVSAGRLASEKQWTHLIGAFGRVAERVPEWRIRVFGEGPARFDAVGLTRKLGLWDRVELPGPTSDMASEWARASIMSLASQPGEGFPLVIQEAMAAGVPVVAYDMPSGPRDQIDDGVDGLLVAQGSEAGLAAALLRLMTDPAERARMGSAALARAATWDSASITARWEEIFAAAVARRGATRAGRSTTLLASRLAARRTDTDATPPPGAGRDLTPIEARSGAFAAVTAAAAGLGVLWWVVPPHAGSAPTVVLPMAARRDFVRALADLPTYLSVHDPEHRGWPSRRGTPAEMLAPLLRGRTPWLLIEPWPDPTTVIGRDCEVAVEFWEDGPDGDLHAVGRAAYTPVMPREVDLTTTQVLGIQVPTHPVMVGPTPADCAFEVDVVYTWVDGRDDAWNATRAARLAGVPADDPTMLTRASSGRARYVDRGELRYSMRSVHLFAPWVRRIHLVTAGQVPTWLDPSHPRINLVDHRDIFPAGALPTFNSHAIESVLHRIEGLAEHFVYLNDDVFLGRPTHPERFFSPAGASAVFLSPLTIGLPGQEQLPYQRAAASNRRLLQKAFGVTTVHTLAHAPHPHRRSVLTEIAERFVAEVETTTYAPFRSATDVSLLSSLAQHYGLITGSAFVDESDVAFVDLTDVVVQRRLKELLRRDREGFCLGDGHDFARNPEKVDQIVAEFLETYFPISAPWER